MSKQITTYTEYLNYKKAMEDELMMMCKKNRPHNVFVCSGQAGIGKTYTASSIFEKYAEVPYIVKGGSISPVELYTTMWQNPDAVIILDDVNEIIKDPKNGAALLKIATDSYKVRKIHWQKRNPLCVHVSNTGKPENNEEIKRIMDRFVATNGSKNLQKSHASNLTFPDMFFFTGAIVILTNKSLKTIDMATEGAISNRGAHMEMSFTLDGIMNFLKEFSKTFTEYNGTKLKKATVSTVIKFLSSAASMKFLRNSDRMISIRNLGSISNQYQEHGKELNIEMLECNTEPHYYG